MADSGRADPLGGGAENSSGVFRVPIDPVHLGRAEVTPSGDIVAGSWTTFKLTYTAGSYGIDDSGSLRICFRFASDQTPPQFDRPEGPNYTTIEASNGAVLQYRFDPKGNVRPWDKTLQIKVVNGFLLPGDTITVRFGVTDHGGPGMRIQTFCEESYEFRVLVDPIATFNFQPLSEQPVIRIVPGEPVRYVATLPSKCRTGERFALHVKGEDLWGNPSDRCDLRLFPRASRPVDGLPEYLDLRPGQRFLRLEGLSVEDPGPLEITLVDVSDQTVCMTNPLRITEAADLWPFWVDLHGQSEETIGTGSAREYFKFARDLAPVDATSHQGNDFQITNEFWQHLDGLTETFEVQGRFLAIPGYEWSGNTGLGGDRNVFFPETGRQIRRSSHALIGDVSDLHTDALTAADLFEAFAANGEWDVVCYAHCGGRYADIKAAHDGRFEKSVEVHSSWGTFEWLLHDAFDLGYRVGVVANSDGHKGRPGASYPGASMFGAIGGLTCLLMPELSRSALFECLRKRRHYATTGGPTGRPIIDLSVELDRAGTIYEDDPALGEVAGISGLRASMGDIVHLPDGDVTIDLHAHASSPVERIEIFNGQDLIHSYRPHESNPSDRRLRILWEGAEYRGRFRQVIWDGTVEIPGNEIESFQPINFFNPDKTLRREGPCRVSWSALTTGNMGGCDLWLRDGQVGRLSVRTPLIEADLDVSEIGQEEIVFSRDEDLPRRLRIFRLPDVLTRRDVALRKRINIKDGRDNPIFVRMTQEDGTISWTSPVYFFRSMTKNK